MTSLVPKSPIESRPLPGDHARSPPDHRLPRRPPSPGGRAGSPPAERRMNRRPSPEGRYPPEGRSRRSPMPRRSPPPPDARSRRSPPPRRSPGPPQGRRTPPPRRSPSPRNPIKRPRSPDRSPSPGDRARFPEDRDRSNKRVREERRSIYVGNLPYDIRKEELRTLCSKYGEVFTVTLGARGFGFVLMDPRGARKALEELDKKTFGGRTLHVNEAFREDRM
eukprot:TRINITY_DN4305_c0_g1_i1.p1 TRINITY_DN4305_c0_g1~~TRINITY_DN4305_c0_g1_i1.p1  ORF type:complete len:221 (+),score=35.23 TRINITY_DN4305_c0_g1_i1:26-688(+)